jgi:rubrerythrin
MFTWRRFPHYDMDKTATISEDSKTLSSTDAFQARLIHILQLAYSGERAAAYAYRGHWRAVSNPEEKERIHLIEDEEWHHRRLVGQVLAELGASPDRRREFRAIVIGRTLQALCRVSGWLLPMYGAGKLERRNIVEYQYAAQYAVGCGRIEFVDCLLTMAEVEWEHEQYFRAKVLSHRVGRMLPIWPAPPPKEKIRHALNAHG